MDSAWPYLVQELGLVSDPTGSGDSLPLSTDSDASGSDSDCCGEDQCPRQGGAAYPGTTVVGGILVTLDADGDVVMADGSLSVHDNDVEVEGERDHKPGDVWKEEQGGGRVDGREVPVGITRRNGHRNEIDKRPSGRFESEEDSGPYEIKE